MAQNAAPAVNHDQGLWPPETTSRCVTESGTHDFKVNNYPLLEGLGVGKYITSSTFSVGGYDWNMRFYPDGPSKDSDHAFAILFYLRSAKDVRANITLTVMELEKDGHVQVKNTADDVYVSASSLHKATTLAFGSTNQS
jgi:speckle-type POZ protein